MIVVGCTGNRYLQCDGVRKVGVMDEDGGWEGQWGWWIDCWGWGGGDYNVLKWGGMEKQGGELES